MKEGRSKKGKKIDGSKLKIGIVVSRYNGDITTGLLSGVLEVLKRSKVKKGNITIEYTTGAFEIPFAVKRLLKTGKYNGVVALGCIVRGETDHDFHLASSVTSALLNLSLEYMKPVGLGVLTVNNLKQARVRSSRKHNHGAGAAEAVIEMI